ncbi:MAG: co-chaperone GroES [Patescibacteria group bacterium]
MSKKTKKGIKKTVKAVKKSGKKMTEKAKGVKSAIIPLADRVLVRPLTEAEMEKKTNFGIIIPETIDEGKVKDQGIVVAVGKGKYDDGKLNPMTVKEGDRVVFSRYGFDEVKLKGEEYFILKEENILAIIK